MTAGAPVRDRSGGLTTLLGSPALRMVGKRTLMAVPIVLGASILTFWVLSLIPGGAAQQLLGPEATAEQIAALEQRLGLDRSGPVRYLQWLGGAVTGDLGNSVISGQPVTPVLAERLAVTGQLVGMAFVLSLGLAIPVALLAAYRPNRLFDRLSMLVSITGLSVANYVLALLLVLLFAVQLSMFPAIGFVPLSESVTGNLHSLALPAVAIAFPLFCFYTRFLRGDLVDQLQGEDYIITARAKGVGPWRVLVRHAFRNSSFGLITVVGLNLGTLIGATVIIEQIFALPGLGQLLLQAINTRDFVVVQACVVVFAVIAVLANLLADLLYAVLDPRIRYGSR
ncbi:MULTISPECIES: ABC transporter permease [Pseudonocardia]|uniref:Glutathione transport system permease protein GsiC n=2 Tax=Pseudonocardia TaxID=1847 RepID=A0A1Y2MX61_PSEAH|nr:MULTISPECIES: ABC transporter permease [Pseudonocardia]OSY39711.1 Glutathione transport system permease protein GsiC [Pseudonocardia autotrophica]TDN72841.1 peptide/nickel transport system permease protein [Pseudonocardia autotrophica]BBG03559.1 peptide ABC transporter [Pseudonocardia autotrophica]GEC28552.1 peptide ABC transporter [Pseudonocardia saturnea]